MKQRKHLSITLLLITAFLLTSCNNGNDPRELKFKPIKFDAPKTERLVLDNGAIVHLLHDHELPLINIMIKVNSGSIYDHIGKEGLASLTTTLIRSGGAKGISPEEIDRELEFMGGQIELKANAGETNIVLSFLKKDIETGLTLTGKMINQPAFRKDKVTLEKERFLEGIKRQNDNPEDAALRETIKKIYSGGSYGRFPTSESIKSIGEEDLKSFHRYYFRADNMIIGVSGDFDRHNILKMLGNIFEVSREKEISFPDIKVPTQEKGIYLINRKISQSVIRMGHIGLKKNSPDNHAVRVMNRILGGGSFTSRLMKEVRTTRGLSYSVWSMFKMGDKTEGLFLAGCDTKPESTGEAIEVILKTIKDMRINKVTDEELAVAKESIINSFAFAFKGPDEVILNRLNVEYYGLTQDYIETFREKIDAVTKEDVLRVAQKHLRPDDLSIIVMGNKDAFDRPLSTFGDVEKITRKD